ncbi:TDRD5 protein, partial [Nothocercus nigrocapillus]|nr:TDRD5 protein [Nothocercus nigrocapillus]
MSRQAQLMDVLKKEVRSLLMAAKEGLSPAQLEHEYRAMIGKPLPLGELGYLSTMELVAAMPEVVTVCPHGKDAFVLKAVADETTKDIAKLISKQRTSVKARNAASRANGFHCSRNQQRLPRRGRTPPVLPAAVKSELKDLLSSSPVLLSDFNKAFSRRFGRAFKYMQYGFFSMLEMLRSVSDIIAIEQSRAGSLLTLKKNSSTEEQQEKTLQAPAIEIPPPEPSCDAESFHQATEEKSEAEESQAVDCGDKLKQLQALECSLLTTEVTTSEIPPDAVQSESLCRLPPLERSCLVGVFVEFIISPSQFYIQVCSRETSDKLQDLMIEMRRCYSNKMISDRYIMPESLVQPGQLCCVMVSEDKWWYRVIVHRLLGEHDVEVFYADFGNLGTVQRSCLRFLKWCYLKLPAQAIPCSLAWVKPVEDTWTDAATLQFRRLCGSKLLVGIVDEYVDDILHLFLCDTSSEGDIYFHNVLKSEGHAEVCRENIPSQGFQELNPLALYVKPSAKQESAGVVEPNLPLQQESLDAKSGTASSRLDEGELCGQEWHFSADKEIWDDMWPLLDQVDVPKTADEEPEFAKESANENTPDLMTVVKTPHSLGESSKSAVLSKSLEDFYISLIYSSQPAETSQEDPDQTERCSNKARLFEAVPASVLLLATPFILDQCNNKVKNEELPETGAVVLGSAHRLADQEAHQKLYVPPTSPSATLGAAARLAASSGLFQWFPSLRKEM